MRAALVATSLTVLSGYPVSVSAADWSATGFVNQRFVGEQDVGSGGDNEDQDTLTSTTSLGVTISAQTKTTRWLFSPAVTGTLTTDEGDNRDTASVNPRFQGSVRHTKPRFSVGGFLSVVPDFRSSRQIDTVFVPDPDTGLLDPTLIDEDVDALEIVIRGGLDASYALDPRNTVNASVFARAVEYDQTTEVLQPTRSFGGTLGWSQRLNTRTSGGVTGSVRQFTSDREDQGDTLTFSLAPNLSHSFTSRHSGTLNLGASVIEQDGEDSTIAFDGSGTLRYASGATQANMGFSQSVEQNDFGAIELVSRLRAGVSHRINAVSSVNLTGQFALVRGVNDSEADRQVLSVSPGYRLSLTEAWGVSLGYGFNVTNEDSETSASHRLFMTISRDLDLF